MSNQFTILSYENKSVETVIIGGEIFFRATQLAEMLEYANPHDAIKKHVDTDDLVKREVIDSRGRKQNANFVNESGMYSLVLGSKQEKAKKVKRWVTNEVLPSIRKTGSYSLTINIEQQYELKKAVNEKSFETGIHYGTIYTMLYDEFKIPRYEELLAKYFDKAITFIKSIGKVIGGKSNLANAPENLDKSRTFALALIKNGALKFDEISNSYESLLNHLSVVTDNLSMVTNQINHVKRMINHIDHGDGAIYDALNEAQIYLFLGDEIRKNATEKAKSLFKPLNLKNI